MCPGDHHGKCIKFVVFNTHGGCVTWLTLTLHYSHKIQPSTTRRTSRKAGKGVNRHSKQYFIALTIFSVSCSMLQQTIHQKSLVWSVLAAWLRSYGHTLKMYMSWWKLFWLRSISFQKQALECTKMAASAGFFLNGAILLCNGKCFHKKLLSGPFYSVATYFKILHLVSIGPHDFIFGDKNLSICSQ